MGLSQKHQDLCITYSLVLFLQIGHIGSRSIPLVILHFLQAVLTTPIYSSQLVDTSRYASVLPWSYASLQIESSQAVGSR